MDFKFFRDGSVCEAVQKVLLPNLSATKKLKGAKFGSLGSDIGEKAHESGAFDCYRKCALLLLSESGALMADNLSVGCEKHANQLDVFIVDVLDVICRKIVLLFFHN